MAHTGASHICATPLGYTRNARPGPLDATDEIGLRCTYAMLPISEKITKPAKNAVPLFTNETSSACLQDTTPNASNVSHN